MHTSNIKFIALSISLVFSASAIAQNISKNDYKAGNEKISAEFKSAKAGCGSLSGNANDICLAVASGQAKVAKADLEAHYKPSVKNRYSASIARAEANYAVASERCDDMDGNVKDVCVKEAQAAETKAKADAEVQMKTSEANITANKKSAAARSKAKSLSTEAHKDASAEKLDADYAVAKEKCDTFAGGAKDKCLDQAKNLFGKS